MANIRYEQVHASVSCATQTKLSYPRLPSFPLEVPKFYKEFLVMVNYFQKGIIVVPIEYLRKYS